MENPMIIGNLNLGRFYTRAELLNLGGEYEYPFIYFNLKQAIIRFEPKAHFITHKSVKDNTLYKFSRKKDRDKNS